MKYLRFFLIFSFVLFSTSCEKEEDDTPDTYNENPTAQDPGNNSGSPSWAQQYWKRDNAGTYLDLTSSQPVFCSGGEIVAGSYSNVNWQSANVGYFTLTNAGDVVNFEIKKNGSSLILAPYDSVAQQTHSPANYSTTNTFPCNGGSDGGNNGGGNDGNGNNGGNDGGGNDNQTVAIKFWANQDFGCGYISVNLSSVGSSQLSGYFSGGPDCNTTAYGGYFSGLQPGTYSYSASCENYTWSGSVNLQASCTTFQLAL